jgi:hypothetical protein
LLLIVLEGSLLEQAIPMHKNAAKVTVKTNERKMTIFSFSFP